MLSIKIVGGVSGIRTHGPKKGYCISNAARYDHFDITPNTLLYYTIALKKIQTFTIIIYKSLNFFNYILAILVLDFIK